MIGKLKRRFIALAMAALVVMLSVIVAGMNIINYNSVVSNADDTLEMLSSNKGRLPLFFGDAFDDMLNDIADMYDDIDAATGDYMRKLGPGRDMGDMSGRSGKAPSGLSRDEAEESRYFTVLIDSDGQVTGIDTERIYAVDEDEAAVYAAKAAESGKDKGFIDDYRYAVSDEGSYKRVTFLDCGRTLGAFKEFLRASIMMSVLGLLVLFAVICYFAGRIVRPVAESYEKQKRFITDAGHEIKTPLAIIKANIDVMRMDLEDIEDMQAMRAGAAGSEDETAVAAAVSGGGGVVSAAAAVSGGGGVVSADAAVSGGGGVVSADAEASALADVAADVKECSTETAVAAAEGDDSGTPATADAAELAASVASLAESLGDIDSQVDRLTSLTNDLVYLSRMEEAGQALTMTEIPVSDIVTETADSFSALAQERRKTLKTTIAPGLTMQGSSKEIEKLTSILVENALKYSPEEDVIGVDLRKEGKTIILEVRNKAAATLNDDDLAHVFDRFYRSDTSRNSQTGGHGIGLSMASAIVAAHGGKIRARRGDGTEFIVTASMPAT